MGKIAIIKTMGEEVEIEGEVKKQENNVYYVIGHVIFVICRNAANQKIWNRISWYGFRLWTKKWVI